jgi:hypothetical protein
VRRSIEIKFAMKRIVRIPSDLAPADWEAGTSTSSADVAKLFEEVEHGV